MSILRSALCAALLTVSASVAAPAAAQGGALVFGGDGFSVRLQFGERFDPAPIRRDRGWRRLGQIELSDRESRNVLRVPDDRRFEAIQLCVGRFAAEIDRFRIVFANGGNQDIDVRPVIGEGECTRVIELRGRNARDIRRIVIRGQAARDRGPQPILTLRGRLAADEIGRGGGGGGGAAEGARRLAEFVLPDDAVRAVADVRGSRRFDEVRLCVARQDARIQRVRVIFANGGDQVFPLSRVVQAGACTPWGELNGRRSREIDRIVLIGESRRARGPQPIVRIFGR